MGLPKFRRESKETVVESGPIDWIIAKEMIKQYRDNRNHIPIQTGEGIERLNGFRVKKSDLLSLFKNQNVTEVFICFGVTKSTLSTIEIPINDDDQYFTPILLGLENNQGKLIIDTSKAIDFCDPCPTECPANLISVLYH